MVLTQLIIGQLFLKVFHVTKFGGSVNDHINVITGIGNDSIVNDTSVGVGDEGETS